MAHPLARLLHRLAHVPVLGTALFVVSDTLILLAVAILDPWLARILLYKIQHGQHGRRTELRTGLDFYRYIEYPRVMEWLNRIRPKRTLDIGSNYGLVWQWSAARGIETHATDICDITLTDARAAAPQRVRDRSPISMHNATRLGFKPRSFDAVSVIRPI